ncbi:Crp/Fnr family transcriptional regulator [Verrucomicrobiota bacterium sgz303538]
MSAKPELLQHLRNTLVFREFTDDEIRSCLDLFETEHVSAGQNIVQQDQLGDSMYFIVDGRARVVHHAEGREIQLRELVSGDFFGEIALVDRGPRSADVEAITDCTLLKITQATISAFAGVYPACAFKFLTGVGRILVDRVRQTNRRYVDSLLLSAPGKGEPLGLTMDT